MVESGTKSGLLCSESVFRSVYDAHFRLLRNFLLYRFGDSDRADDTAQNAFVILWQNCGKISSEQAKSFLFTTAIRLSLNEIKHEKVVANFKLRAKPTGAHSETPEFKMVEDELRNALERGIAALGEKQRTVFLLNRFEKQTYAEIAELLGISVKTVEKRMHDALVALRPIIKNI